MPVLFPASPCMHSQNENTTTILTSVLAVPPSGSLAQRLQLLEFEANLSLVTGLFSTSMKNDKSRHHSTLPLPSFDQFLTDNKSFHDIVFYFVAFVLKEPKGSRLDDTCLQLLIGELRRWTENSSAPSLCHFMTIQAGKFCCAWGQALTALLSFRSYAGKLKSNGEGGIPSLPFQKGICLSQGLLQYLWQCSKAVWRKFRKLLFT